MNRLFLLTTLFSVVALSYTSLSGHDRYGAPHSRNSLNYRGGSRYSGPSAPGAPRAPGAPHAPGAPQSPRLPHSPRVPAHQSYGSRNVGYGGHQSGIRQPSIHQSAPGLYGGGRHYNPSGASLNQYSGPVSHSGPSPYGGPVPYSGQVHGSVGGNHYSSAKRSVYQQPEQHYGSSSSTRSGYSQPQNYGHSTQHAQSSSNSHGREMKYTIRDPKNRGTTHVTETHVVSNKQMHGAEAEAAMKKLMGSMGPASDGGFNDFIKDMGLPFY